MQFDGYQLFHNYIRPRMGLEEKTLAKLQESRFEGDDKWITLIQNASKK